MEKQYTPAEVRSFIEETEQRSPEVKKNRDWKQVKSALRLALRARGYAGLQLAMGLAILVAQQNYPNYISC